MNTSKKSLWLWVAVIIIAGVGSYYFFNGRDERTTGERVGDAVDSFTETHSLHRAGQQFKDQTPAQKVGNEIKDKADENQNH